MSGQTGTACAPTERRVFQKGKKVLGMEPGNRRQLENTTPQRVMQMVTPPPSGGKGDGKRQHVTDQSNTARRAGFSYEAGVHGFKESTSLGRKHAGAYLGAMPLFFCCSQGKATSSGPPDRVLAARFSEQWKGATLIGRSPEQVGIRRAQLCDRTFPDEA